MNVPNCMHPVLGFPKREGNSRGSLDQDRKIVRKAIGFEMDGGSPVVLFLGTNELLIRSFLLRLWRVIPFYSFQVLRVVKEAL